MKYLVFKNLAKEVFKNSLLNNEEAFFFKVMSAI